MNVFSQMCSILCCTMAHNGASGQTLTKKYLSIYTVNFYHSILHNPVTRSNFCTSERRLTLCLGGHPSELDSNSCWLITVAPDELAAARSCRPVGRAPLDGPDSCTHTLRATSNPADTSPSLQSSGLRIDTTPALKVPPSSRFRFKS